MGFTQGIWASPAEHLRATQPGHPVIYAAPSILQATARRFQEGFPGLVTYAVKANPDPLVLTNFAAAGITAFDVASPYEMELVREAVPGAVLHYNNPVRARDEIVRAVALDVASWSVDSESELAKLEGVVPAGCEVSVRFKLPVTGGAYDFGTKFGATPEAAAQLLQRVAALGYVPAMTFHPGTQCTAPDAWSAYIDAAAGIARRAGVTLARLNVGGGFPARRQLAEPEMLEDIFAVISQAVRRAFGPDHPRLVCEPGRAMVAEGFSLAAQVKAIRDGGDIFLNDGVYGALSELPVMGNTDRLSVLSSDGRARRGNPVARAVFGPTCDSIDRLPGTLNLPGDVAEGDFILFQGLGAYSTATVTRFNGYGALEQAVVLDVSS
ncbi:MAG: type III PLP-dependent enzyme [Paracoccaceae bacterium]